MDREAPWEREFLGGALILRGGAVDDLGVDHFFLARVFGRKAGWIGRSGIGLVEVCADDPDVIFDVSGEEFTDGGADGRNEEGEAEDVSEESGCEEDGPGDEDHEAVEDLLMRHAAVGSGFLEFGECTEALVAGEGGTDETGEDDDDEGGRETDTGPDFHEEVELDEGNGDEKEEEAGEHGRRNHGLARIDTNIAL